MNKISSNEEKVKPGEMKKHIHVNLGLLTGLFGGALLGCLIGAAVHDIPLYTGFGMLLGMAISYDMMSHYKRKDEKAKENDEMR